MRLKYTHHYCATLLTFNSCLVCTVKGNIYKPVLPVLCSVSFVRHFLCIPCDPTCCSYLYCEFKPSLNIYRSTKLYVFDLWADFGKIHLYVTLDAYQLKTDVAANGIVDMIDGHVWQWLTDVVRTPWQESGL